MKCCICKNEIERIPTGKVTVWDQGNNAEPIARGRCCGACDREVVLPARLAHHRLIGVRLANAVAEGQS